MKKNLCILVIALGVLSIVVGQMASASYSAIQSAAVESEVVGEHAELSPDSLAYLLESTPTEIEAPAPTIESIPTYPARRLGASETLIRRPFEQTATLDPGGADGGAGELILISVWIRYSDQNGNLHNAPGMKVLACDGACSSGTVLYTAMTGTTGQALIVFVNDLSAEENGYDLTVEILTETDDYRVSNVVNGVLPAASYIRMYETIDYQDGDHYLYINFAPSYTDASNKNIVICQALNMGFAYLDQLVPNRDNHFLYVTPTTGTSFFLPITYLETIYLNWTPALPTPSIPCDHIWDTILHEFGHYVAHEYEITSFLMAQHGIEDLHYLDRDKDDAATLIWSEAWAYYFSTRCQETMQAGNLGISGVGDGDYATYSLENLSAEQMSKGEGTELSVAGLLYDIADGIGESFDTVSLGDQTVFDLAVGSADDTPYISDFLQKVTMHFQNQGVTSASDLFGTLLRAYSFNVQPVVEGPASYLKPTFTWTIVGGSDPYYNNRFTVQVMDQDGAILYESEEYTDGSSITVSDAGWGAILSSTSSFVYWRIFASSIDDTPETLTGPYPSELETLYLPTIYHAQLDLIVTRSLTVGGYHWFRFEAPEAAVYEFYTTGTTNTVGDFFNLPVPNQSMENIISSVDGGGLGTNFKTAFYLEEGQAIFVRVRGYNWTSTGTFKFRVVWSPLQYMLY
ncbi:MAG: hypothetical protein WC509_07245 [Candidatus Izemoplasmatales bacterium]